MIFNHQIHDLASKQKSKKVKSGLPMKSPELLNFPLHFNLRQKKTANNIISTFNRYLVATTFGYRHI